MPRVPLISGSRLVVATVPHDALVLRPPSPGRATDVAAATREALRFPLDGEPLEALAAGASRAAIVVEPPALPVGSVQGPQRPSATAAVSDALAELGVPTERQTLLVAGGLARRASHGEIAALVTPDFRRRRRGGTTPPRRNPERRGRGSHGSWWKPTSWWW